MKFKSLQVRLLAIFVPLFVLGNVLLSVFLYFSFSKTLAFNAEQRLSAMGSDYVNQVESAMNSRILQLQLLADSAVFRSPDDRDQIISVMKDAFQVLATFDTVLFMWPDGNGVRHDGTTGQYTDREYFQNVMRTQKPYISEVLISRGTGKPSVIVVMPVMNGANLSGLLCGTYPLDNLTPIVRELR